MAKPVAVVTGVGGDIGRAISAGLLADGYAVLASDISKPGLDAALAALNGGDAIRGVICDIIDSNAVAAMAMGPVTLLVNNAGGISSASLHAANTKDWQGDLALNLVGPFNYFKAVEGALEANHGVLVNIASVNGMGVYGHPGYSAAKAGLIQFTRAVAVEYGKFGVRARTNRHSGFRFGLLSDS